MRMARLGFKEEEDMIIDIVSSRLLTGYEIIAELEIKGMNFGYSNERDTYCLTLGKLRQHNLDRLIE